MDALSNTNRLVQALRRELEKRQKAQGKSGAGRAARVFEYKTGSASEIAHELSRLGANQNVLARTILERLIAEQFGPSVYNEAKFQAIVDQVYQVIRNDEAIGIILYDVVTQILEDT